MTSKDKRLLPMPWGKPPLTLAQWLLKPKRGRPKGTVSTPVREAAQLYKRLMSLTDPKWRGKHGNRKEQAADFVIEKMKEAGRPLPDRRSLLNYLNRSKRQQ